MGRGQRRGPRAPAAAALALAVLATACSIRPATSADEPAGDIAGDAAAETAAEPAAEPDPGAGAGAPDPGPVPVGEVADPPQVPTAVDPTPAGVPGEWSMAILEPASLLPGGIADRAGRQVAAALYTTLVELDPVTAEPVLAVAGSITTEDDTTFAITVAEGWTFHDGTPIDAATFVDSFRAVTDPAHDLPGAAAHRGIAEVALVGDRALAVTLDQPDPSWPSRLADPAFAPLHPRCLPQPQDCADAPIGNGPYRMDGERQPGVRVAVTRWDDHPRHDPQAAVDIEFRIYGDVDTAVLELEAGLVDVVGGIPGTEEDRLGELFDGVVAQRTGTDVELLVHGDAVAGVVLDPSGLVRPELVRVLP